MVFFNKKGYYLKVYKVGEFVNNKGRVLERREKV